MREKKKIAKLTAKVTTGTVAFPQKVEHSFHAFRTDLLNVLEENDLGGSWDFDEESQTFYATWVRRDVIEGVGMELERHVDLDPRKPLDQEVERLLKLKNEFDQFAIRAFSAVRANEYRRTAAIEDFNATKAVTHG